MKVGITLGDPAGIGPEIILKTAPFIKHMKNAVIFGNRKIFEKTARDLHLLNKYKALKNNIADCAKNVRFQYGKPTQATGRIAIRSIDCALQHGVDVLITPPIVKDVVRHSVSRFVGHTEYLARYFHTKRYAMVGLWRTKRIMLLTTHLPLRRIFRTVTVDNIYEKILLLNWGVRKYSGIKTPSIGVSALNPHGLEFSLGEDEIISKAIIRAQKKKIKVYGPFPGDTLFDREFDGFLAMYHDQAMVYLKSKKNGLNFTMGLPIIRLSPLYGAALDIAGKNKAESSGLVAALRQGVKLYNNAKKYEAKNK